MINRHERAFWVPYDENSTFPTVEKAHQVISEYCEENGDVYTFHGDDEIAINDKVYEIYRGCETERPGIYGIKCIEK